MKKSKSVMALVIVSGMIAGGARAQKPPLLPEKDVAALANELSGETAKRNLEGIARFHRMRGSKGFHEAAELVAERARAYGLSDVEVLRFPADGKIFYGTQRSRPTWEGEVGDLWEVPQARVGDEAKGASADRSGEQRKKSRSLAALGMTQGGPTGAPSTSPGASEERDVKIASYEAEPVMLAEDSESADVTADLVDVGEGTKESDYAGKDVKGKIVLVSAQPGAAQDLAVGKFGAAGIVSYAQNQKTAWWGEDENLIRWGHLETFSENKTFAFMVSLKAALAMRERLARGEKILLHAAVKAGQHAGNYEVVTATIPGADPKLRQEEIAFSCHLDHQRPGANDNASGCVTILEVARTLQKLINEGKLARPARTIRFIWPPEIEGTLALLNSVASSFETSILTFSGTQERWRAVEKSWAQSPVYSAGMGASGPKLEQSIKAVVHMDMVGGGLETKAVFHVTRGPMSLPSFVHDVAWAFAEFANEQSYKFAATGQAEYPLVVPEGGKEPLRAEYSAYTMGSDHDVYQDSSFGIPAIYLNDWPDRYIHTNFDSAANIDPTKLKRAAFIGAASGYFLAQEIAFDVKQTREAQAVAGSLRHAETQRRAEQLAEDEAGKVFRAEGKYNRRMEDSYVDFVHGAVAVQVAKNTDTPLFLPMQKNVPPEPIVSGDGRLMFKRRSEPKGPLAVFGYDYFAEHTKAAGVATPKLLSYEGLWGGGEEYAYEVLNFADGKRNAQEIRDAVSAEYGPVPVEMVLEYLRALEKIGVVEQMK